MTWLTSIKSKLPAISLLILAAFIIFYQFPLIPQNLAFDETEFAKLALSLKNQPYTVYSEMATGHATMYFYILLTSFELFGVNSFALRLPSAIFGLIGSLVFYFLVRKIFQVRNAHSVLIPYLLTFIFITSRWYFQFARFSFEATFLLFLELVSLYCFVIFIQHKSRKALIMAGIFAGLAFNSYTPGRLFFLLPVIGLLLHREYALFSKNTLLTLITFITPFVILTAPLNIYLATHQDIRLNQLSYLRDEKLNTDKKLSYLGQNAYSNLAMFHIKGDLNGRHNYPGKPMLNPILGVFFVLGVLFTLKNIKNFHNQLFLIYFFISLIPTLLTYPAENPHALRTFTVIPAVVYFMGNFLLELWKFKKYNRIIIAGVTALILVSAVYELRTYFSFQTQVFPEAFEMRKELNTYLDKTP